MSVGPLGMIGSAAGSQLPQAKGTETERTHQDAAAQSRQTEASRQAEAAAGVGQTQQDQEASDRDADGRRVWEREPARERGEQELPTEEEVANGGSRDASGTKGNHLDLSG